MKTLLSLILPFFFLCSIHEVIAQESFRSDDKVATAYSYILHHLEDWSLQPQDVDGMTIRDMYTDKSSGITRIYFLQHYQDIPVYNAILNININKQGNVFFSGNRFISDLNNKINTTHPSLSPLQAVNALSGHLGLPREELKLKAKSGDGQFTFDPGNIAKEDILTQLIYQPYHDAVRLTWDISLAPVGTQDNWSSRVDAITGEVLDQYNWTVYCNQDEVAVKGESNLCYDSPGFLQDDPHPVTTGPLYNVWPAPTESPVDGPRTFMITPADTLASPYGWHDTNGHPGSEFTITRGNNVFAYQDRDNLGKSSNDEPDGGPDHQFDFPFDPTLEPEQYLDASVVNLFYWMNYMHDFSYHFGFDEAAGNFQLNNYGRGGTGKDEIHAAAQQGANTGSKNNAYYSHKVEGTSPVIAMYVFYGTKRFLTVDTPANIAGSFKTSFPSAGWGAGTYLNGTPISGEVVIADDGIENPYASDACEEIQNASAIAGKIALIDRGGCEFGWKALQLQNAGAIAILVCSIDDDDYTMNPGTYGSQVHIPILMIGASDCPTIRPYAGNGLFVTFKDPGQNGPTALDSDLDGHVLAHEFSHGISGRLVGGPATLCLHNAEEMSEGWSDFIALVTTAEPGDNGETPRAFASYATNDANSGRGFRRFPYSTDMNVMPLTYGDIAPSQEEHNLGEVWASTLWDMYWAFVDQYGWKADLYDTTSGNYRATRLVFDGMKNIPCSPGFVDGRNGILAADLALYGGVDTCMIWEVFARRGIGFSADQGSPEDAGDQKEAFDLPPGCRNAIVIEKSVTDFIQAGNDIQVELKVGNYKNDLATNVIVTDEIPEGTSFKLNSSNYPASVQGNIISYHLGDMNFQDEIVITYTLETNADAWSKRKFLDEVNEESTSKWLAYTIGNEASNDWAISEFYPGHSGIYAWLSEEAPQKTRQALELNPEEYIFHVEGDHPAFRFYHRYQTQPGLNAGVVDVKEVGATKWDKVDDAILRNGYDSEVDYRTFILPHVNAFTGTSGDEFKDTYVDLSHWQGKDIQVRFLFGTEANAYGGMGWLIDDIEFMDLLTYNGEACVTTDQGDNECTIAPEGGTIVDSKEGPVSATEPLKQLSTKIYPNPASDMITIALSGDQQQNVLISFLTIDGRELFTNSFDIDGHDNIHINTSNVPAGLYVVKLMTKEGQYVAKVVVEK